MRGLWSLALLSAAATANIEGTQWVFHHEGDRPFTWRSVSRGTPLLPLNDLVKAFELKSSFDPKTFEITLTQPKTGSTVRFYTYDRSVEGRLKSPGRIEGFTIRLSKPPQFDGISLCVPLDFGDRALRPLLNNIRPSDPLIRPAAKADIVLDPGHGGNDYGASVAVDGIQLREKDQTLRLATELKVALAKRGVRAVLTREDDSFLALPERSHFANRQDGAKLYLSLHMNSEPTGKNRGAEMYVLSLGGGDTEARTAVAAENQMIPEDLGDASEHALAELRAQANFETSLKWAKDMSAALVSVGRKAGSRPVQTGPFYVLYGAAMPAVLVEWGYLTNGDDRADGLGDKPRAKAIDALAASIAAGLKRHAP